MTSRLLLVVSAMLLLAMTGSAAEKSTNGWANLFNGKNLDGWMRWGGKANYQVQNGEIVGSAGDRQNTFLCTTRHYTNFNLEVDFKVDDSLNSGVQIRSRVHDQNTIAQWNGKTYKIPAGRVHGLQVEIDPGKRAWSGGVYGEGSIGWVNNLEKNDSARQAFKKGEWNHFRIETQGDVIKTWINEVPAANLTNNFITAGFIGLQVHGIGTNRTDTPEVRFKNIRIQELP